MTDVQAALPGSSEQRITIRLDGNPKVRYCTLGPRQARLLGLVEVPGRPYELRLAEGADPQATVVLPNGSTFSAFELTTLRHKAGDWNRGWQIDSHDPCGFPAENDEGVA